MAQNPFNHSLRTINKYFLHLDAAAFRCEIFVLFLFFDKDKLNIFMFWAVLASPRCHWLWELAKGVLLHSLTFNRLKLDRVDGKFKR